MFCNPIYANNNHTTPIMKTVPIIIIINSTNAFRNSGCEFNIVVINVYLRLKGARLRKGPLIG